MLDNTKLSTENQNIIKRLLGVQGFVYYKPEDKYYKNENKYYRDFFHSFKHEVYGAKFSLHFQKVFSKGILEGYRSLHIVISPHYHFNNYLHNGNDFTPKDCVKTVSDILTYLGLEPQEYDLLKVVNIEFGLNIIPETDIKNLINGILYSKKTAFVVPNPKTPYFRITDTTKYKQIKAYAKGLQFAEFPQYGINENTFRFEVKSKKSVNISKYGINTALDLLRTETYQRLTQEIVDEWEQILLTNQSPDFSDLKTYEVEFIQKANKKDFWEDLKQGKHRNTFNLNKEKYYKILRGKNNLHTQIKGQIIDKLISLSKCAYFPSETPINIEKRCFEEIPPTLIKGQSAHFNNYNRLCLVTRLDISMQRKGSKYLGSAGLKWYRNNDPKIYKEIELNYLTSKMKTRSMDDRIYYMAHNIRNTKTNPNNNPKYSRQRFEARNYHHQQLQLTF